MTAPLRLFNSLARELETFRPVHPGEARVYSCGPTVSNDPHIGNMRAYVFADDNPAGDPARIAPVLTLC